MKMFLGVVRRVAMEARRRVMTSGQTELELEHMEICLAVPPQAQPVVVRVVDWRGHARKVVIIDSSEPAVVLRVRMFD